MNLTDIKVGENVRSDASGNFGVITDILPNSGQHRDYWEDEISITWSTGNKTVTPYVALDKVEYLGKTN